MLLLVSGMKGELVYVELKTGQFDCGPAWIGFAERSKSGRTLYFNDRAFQSCKGRGVGANYFDLETGEQYWISGVKGDLSDRHWAGSGIVLVERKALRECMNVVGLEEFPKSGYDLVDLEVGDVRERVKALENEKVRSDGE
ncbi:MAG: hypothetical protein CMO55_16650 [Verrucomicrobiales bacterium]|nr:hypothetical protein [Verrucomicrobiales bacterium]